MRLSKTDLLQFMDGKLGIDVGEIDAETRLFSSGIIDSAGMVELIVFVESTTQIQFEPDDVTLDHLDSIDRILSFVERRHGQ